MPDSWLFRRWVYWPLCAVRRHPDTFWLERRINGAPMDTLVRCSCGRRMRSEACAAEGTEDA